jgi:hypothetical protein
MQGPAPNFCCAAVDGAQSLMFRALPQLSKFHFSNTTRPRPGWRFASNRPSAPPSHAHAPDGEAPMAEHESSL